MNKNLKKVISAAAALTISASSFAALAVDFPDVEATASYYQAVQELSALDVISGFEDGTFKPDELVTVSAARGILSRYAAYLGIEMPELLALVGEDEEPVLNCDEVIREFFGE